MEEIKRSLRNAMSISEQCDKAQQIRPTMLMESQAMCYVILGRIRSLVE